MRKIALTIAIVVATTLAAMSQELPRQLTNLNLKSLEGQPMQLPYWGEKYLIIFYMDPDRAGMNKDFTDELESNRRAVSDNIAGLVVLNLKDAPFVPNRLVCSMAQKRTENNGAIVLSDESRILSRAWDLGDCNNLFVTLIVTPDGEPIYFRKGVLSAEDRVAFYEVTDQIKSLLEGSTSLE